MEILYRCLLVDSGEIDPPPETITTLPGTECPIDYSGGRTLDQILQESEES